MKKNLLFWIGAVLLLVLGAGLGSCSNDEESEESNPTTLDGTWHMVSAMVGEGYYREEYQAGEVTITFDDKSKNLIVENNSNKEIPFLKSGNYSYNTRTEQRRMLTYQWVDVEYNVITIQSHDFREVKYTYRLYDGTLCLDGGMEADGPGYFFKK